MRDKKFERSFIILMISTLCMVAIFARVEVAKIKSTKPKVVTLIEYRYIKPEPKEPVSDTASKDDDHRPSRGSYIEKPVKKKPNIQTIDYNFDVMEASNFTSKDLSKALNSSSHDGLLHLTDTFVEAEKKYGVNSLYLMSTIGWESGWGKYRANVNNLAGWKNENGVGFRYFDSEYECIMKVAYGISTFYKNSVGTSLGDVTQMYCPDPGYTNNIINIMKERQRKIMNK